MQATAVAAPHKASDATMGRRVLRMKNPILKSTELYPRAGLPALGKTGWQMKFPPFMSGSAWL